jgi:hypothetical protein
MDVVQRCGQLLQTVMVSFHINYLPVLVYYFAMYFLRIIVAFNSECNEISMQLVGAEDNGSSKDL